MTLLTRRAFWRLLYLPFGLGLWARAAAKAQGSAATYRLPAGAEIVPQLGHSSDGASFVFAPDQRRILSAGSDGTLKLWDIGTGRLLRTLAGHETSSIDQAQFSSDGSRILSGGGDGLRLWDARSGALLWSTSTSQYSLANHARAVAFSPDGRYLLSGHRDHKVRLWDADTGVLLRSFEGRHRDEVGSVAFSLDGQFIFSAGHRGTTNDGIVQWDISTGAIVRQFKIDETRTSTMSRAFTRGAISVSLDGQYLLAQSIDLKCTIWNLKTGTITKRFSAAAISPDWRRLAVEAPGKGAEVRDADTDRQIGNVVGAGLFLGTLTFSPDGRVIGAIGVDNAVMLWKVEDGSLVREFLKKQKPTRAVAFAGDGHRVVTGNDAGLQLWDEAKLIRLLSSTGTVMAIAWAPDGNALLAGRADRTIDIWDATKGEVTQRVVLSGPGGGYGNVTSVGFGIDENMVLGANGTIAANIR